MKSKLFILILLTVSLASCQKEDKADAYGTFSADEIILSAENNGKLIFLKADQGDNIRKGDTLAIIDTTLFYLQKKELLAKKRAIESKFQNIFAEISVLKQQKEVLETERNRLEKLLKDSAVSQQQYDKVKGQIDIINEKIQAVKANNSSIFAEIDALNARIQTIEQQKDNCFIRSPITGIVLEKYINIGELATVGRPLFKLANMKKMILTVYVSETQLPSIKIGQKAHIIIDNTPPTPIEGTISWISPQAEFTPKIIQTKEERVNLVYAVKIKVKNDGILKIGMPAEVTFIK